MTLASLTLWRPSSTNGPRAHCWLIIVTIDTSEGDIYSLVMNVHGHEISYNTTIRAICRLHNPSPIVSRGSVYIHQVSSL